MTMTLARPQAAHDPAYFERKKRVLRLRSQGRIFYAGAEGLLTPIPWVSGGAGSYADAPSRRVAWDADGTVLTWTVDNGTSVEISGANMTLLNDENGGALNGITTNNGLGYWAHIFPELREFDGGFAAHGTGGGSSISNVDTSGDTTNGVDGTWTNRIADIANHANTRPDYRTGITSVAVSNVRGVRWRKASVSGGDDDEFATFHIYGEISAAETPDRLLWFDQVAGTEYALPIDYGDIPRGSAEDVVTFLRNNSAALTASSVQVTAEDLFLGSGSWYTFDDGTGFSSTKALASSIANGADSPNITIRRITPDAAGLGLHAGRAYASVGSWA